MGPGMAGLHQVVQAAGGHMWATREGSDSVAFEVYLPGVTSSTPAASPGDLPMSRRPQTGVDARLDPRYPASAVRSIVGVRLSPGDGVELVNISKSGVLVEGCTRYVPGTRVTVIFEGGFTPRATRRGSFVARCRPSSAAPCTTIRASSSTSVSPCSTQWHPDSRRGRRNPLPRRTRWSPRRTPPWPKPRCGRRRVPPLGRRAVNRW